ncbi:MAG: glycosyltransferase [bacterium]|nr:glycosyltransferase [bacterium]
MSQSRVTIAIVNYRTRQALRDCLRSLGRVTNEAELRIVVVDNASGDGSVELLASDFPQVEVISNSTNVGFARGVNQAFERCTTPYFMFLNPDTWVPRHTLARMVKTLESNGRFAVVGAQLATFAGDPLPSVLAGPTLVKEFWNMIPELKAVLFIAPVRRSLARFRQNRVDGQ